MILIVDQNLGQPVGIFIGKRLGKVLGMAIDCAFYNQAGQC